MNGKSYLKRQINAGVRGIVEEIDSLRIKFGFEHVESLTPRVETRLRSGFTAAIPMKVSIGIRSESGLYMNVILTYPMGYPLTETIDVELNAVEIDLNGELQRLQQLAIERVVSQPFEEARKGVELVEFVLRSLNSMHVVVSESAMRAPPTTPIIEDLLDGEDFDDGEAVQNDDVVVAADNSDFIYYTCQRCRWKLCSGSELEIHAPATGTDCSSIFLSSPPVWLNISTSELAGKLHCPNCDLKVGLWGWMGGQCSCGLWVTPAFQINKNRADMKRYTSQVAGEIASPV